MLRWAALILLLLLIALQMQLWSRHNSRHESAIHEVDTLRAAVQQQTEENAALTQRNQALSADVADLKHGGQAVEARARAELGLIKPGETFYQIIDKPGVTVHPAPAVSTAAGR